MTASELPARFEPSRDVDREGLAADIAERRRVIASAMAEDGIEALVVATEANAFYLTGYETTFFGNKSKPFVVVFVPGQTPQVVCHVGEETSVRLDAIDVEVDPYIGPEVLENPRGVAIDYQVPAADAVVDVLKKLGVSTIGVEGSWHFMPGFTPFAFDRLRAKFGGAVLDASSVLWHARRVKSDWEVAQMKVAADAAERCHALFVEDARVGMNERELGRLLRRAAYDAGAEKIGYSGIMAGIDRAPLGGPTNRRWERGQMLFVDICLQLGGGYFADFNRVYASATPTAEQQRAYHDVVVALDRAREIARAGASVRDLADAMIGDAPTIYARVGHGLGLEMPEPPSLSPKDETLLRAGEVLCIEPNTFVDGVGWLVSEEEIVLREGGFELLSPEFPRELLVIG